MEPVSIKPSEEQQSKLLKLHGDLLAVPNSVDYRGYMIGKAIVDVLIILDIKVEGVTDVGSIQPSEEQQHKLSEFHGSFTLTDAKHFLYRARSVREAIVEVLGILNIRIEGIA